MTQTLHAKASPRITLQSVNTKTVYVRLPQEVAQALADAAEATGRSMNQLARDAIEDQLVAYGWYGRPKGSHVSDLD